MPAIDELVAHARGHAAAHPATALAAAPARRLAIVACMDSRLRLFSLLGLDEGDAHVIRNAGGIATADTIRSLAISQHLLGTREVMVIQHTDCGLLRTSDAEFHERMRAHAGVEPDWSFGAFDDLQESVRATVAALRASPFLVHREAIRGFAFDVGTGELREVDCERA